MVPDASTLARWVVTDRLLGGWPFPKAVAAIAVARKTNRNERSLVVCFFELWWLSCVYPAAGSIGEDNGVENRSCFMLPPVELRFLPNAKKAAAPAFAEVT